MIPFVQWGIFSVQFFGSEYIPKQNILDPQDLNLWLRVNGQLRQEVNTSKMLLKIPELIQTISSLMRLEQGDLILTGMFFL